MKKILIIFLFSPFSLLFAQNQIRKITIDLSAFRTKLLTAPNESILGVGQAQQSTNIITLPFADGSSGNFQMVEYAILPKGVNADIKTYYGQKTDDGSVTCRISITKEWLIATIYTKDGIVVVERSKQALNANEYDVYVQTQNDFECKAENSIHSTGKLRSIEGIQNYTNGASLRTYRMALMVTNEFYTTNGNTDASINTYVASIINSLNGLYEKEIAVRFTLVSPNNPASANVFYLKTELTTTYNQDVNVIRVEMNTRYGSANYDIGHCLHTTGGGVAYYGVCNDSYKGGGWSGSTTPTYILLMAHEVGHQFFAPHTFLGNGNANCSDGNRSLSTALEPGSGNTIMSYASLCAGNQNITGGKVPYFHTNSLQNMLTYIQPGGFGNTCGTSTATGNTPPIAVAGSAFTIPKNTPFTLTGSGSDVNNDVLTYTWEEYDFPVANDVGALGNGTLGVGNYTAANSTTAPLFRSRQSNLPVRIFPSLSFILNNANNPNDTEGEDLPDVGRTMNFRLTARDNRAGGGGTHCSAIAVTVDGNSGPFLITSQNSSTLWVVGKTVNITWSVNGTNVAPINCVNVKISLSTDGGLTFPTILMASTPNDGVHSITIPNLPTTQGRVKVEAVGNAFFDVNNVSITITSTCLSGSSAITPATSLSAGIGDASLNLGLSGVGVVITSKSGTIATSDPATTLSVFNTNTSSCINFSNPTYFDKYPFTVATAGNYTFTKTSGDYYIILNIYGSLHNASSPCTNWITSSANYNGSVSVNTSVTVFLNPGNYSLVVTGFSASTPSYPAAYNVTFSPSIYESVPSTPYSYSYVVVKNGAIVAINEMAVLTNASIYSDGTYTIYGLSSADGTDFSSYIGGNFSAFQAALANNVCGTLSSNTKTVTIGNCQQIIILTNPTDNILSGNISKQSSANSGTITATNFVTGAGTRATYQAKVIQLNAGFKADNGTIFKAEIGGCN